MTRPTAALVMWPGVESYLFTSSVLDELAEVVDLVATQAIDLRTWDPEVLAEIEVLVGGWGTPPLDVELLDQMPKLRLLAYAAGSIRATVTDAVWERNVEVSSAAGANALPVAEFAFAAIIMIAKDVFRIRDRHREHRGGSPEEGIGPAGPVGTRGLKVGIVGASRIGRLVIERLQTLDGETALFDPYVDDRTAATLRVEPMTLDDLCRWADIVSIHAPEVPATRHMIDKERLAQMRDGAWLLNTARGSLVDTSALERECEAGRLCAFIDTPDPEPLPASSLLWDLPNVVLTPHIAGSLGNEITRMGDLAVREVTRYVAGKPLEHGVKATDMDRIA